MFMKVFNWKIDAMNSGKEQLRLCYDMTVTGTEEKITTKLCLCIQIFVKILNWKVIPPISMRNSFVRVMI